MSPNEILAILAVTALAGVSLWASIRLRGKPADETHIAAEQLRTSRILTLQHQALAEEHAALAAVHRMRVKRLEGVNNAG